MGSKGLRCSNPYELTVMAVVSLPMQNKDGDGGGDAGEHDSNDENKRERDKSGRFSPAVTHEEVLEYILLGEEDRDAYGVTTRSIAEEFDVGMSTVRRRCDDLVDRGLIVAADASGRILWQVPLELYIDNLDEQRDAFIEEHIRD